MNGGGCLQVAHGHSARVADCTPEGVCRTGPQRLALRVQNANKISELRIHRLRLTLGLKV